jgi:thymidylate kinase
MDEETVEFHRRVRQMYLKLGQEQPDRIKLVDGNGLMEDVSNRVWRVVRQRV